MAVALAASLYVTASVATAGTTITTPSFTPATGELIIVKVLAENETIIISSPVSTAGGITWTQWIESTTPGTAYAAIWSGIITAGGVAMTVSTTNSSGNTGFFSMTLERWTGAQLAFTPAVNVSLGSAAAPSGTITTTGTNSFVSWANGDWNAVAPGTPAYRSGATQEGLYDGSVGVTYTAYYATQTAAVAGVQTYGLTAPTGQAFTLVAIEIQVSAGPKTPKRMTLMGIGA